MMDASKYRVGYFPVDAKYNKWWRRIISKSRPYGAVWICGTGIRVL